MNIRLILLGPPGSGKGTLGKWIEKQHGLARICVGDLLRQEIYKGSELGKKIESRVDSGQWVETSWVLELIRGRLCEDQGGKGWLLDGYPRTLEQLEALKQAKLMPDVVVHLTAQTSCLIQRLLGRRIHLASGRVYHTLFRPPKVPDRDDLTGEPLVARKDDTPHVVLDRLEQDRLETTPVLEAFKKFSMEHPEKLAYIKLDTERPIEEVRNQVDRWLIEAFPDRSVG